MASTDKFCPRCGKLASRVESDTEVNYLCPMQHGVVWREVKAQPETTEPASEPQASAEPTQKREPKALN